MPKSSEEVQRDYSAYRDWMFQKALKTGMTDAEARVWSQEQANLQSHCASASSRSGNGMPRKSDEWPLKENDVKLQVRQWFEWHGWRSLRWNVGLAFDSSGGKVMFGERGMPDLMFIYYLSQVNLPGASLTVWVEVKRPGGTRRPAQIEWHQKEMSRGACVVTVDNFELLRDWYSERFEWLHRAGVGEGQYQLELDKT